jgi:phosphoribosyl 1,2-cyclic phosphodiesterase
LGFVTSSVQAAVDGSDLLVLETNHDPAMLKKGSYPWPLKQRILGNRGHLANEEAAWALVHMKKRPEKVFLAHLSEENNRPELARATVERIMKEQGVNSPAIDITVARQDAMDVWMR